MSEELFIPFPVDDHPDYFTPGFPYLELRWGDASALMNYFEWQQSLVPDLYKGEPFNCQDLDDYQDLTARWINSYANKELPTNEGLPYARSSQ